MAFKDPLKKKEYARQYRIKNRKLLHLKAKQYRDMEENILKKAEYDKIYNIKNRDVLKTKKRQYYYNNKDILIDKILHRRRTIPAARLRHSLRNRLLQAMQHNNKSGSAVRDLGCTIEELKQHLQSKFPPDMNWNNYGLYGWHIDHIVPLNSFDLTDREGFLRACHYTNLQPLWAEENLSKGSKKTPHLYK